MVNDPCEYLQREIPCFKVGMSLKNHRNQLSCINTSSIIKLVKSHPQNNFFMNKNLIKKYEKMAKASSISIYQQRKKEILSLNKN